MAISNETKIQELERIRQENGGALIPQTVVDESRDEEAPLHPVFEWDDEVAGEQYRIHQARNLIKSIRIIKPDRKNPDKQIQVRAYTNVEETQDTARAYYAVADVVKSSDLRAKMAEQAWRDLIAVKARYRELMNAIDEADPGLVQIGSIISSKEQEMLAS